MVNIEWTEDAIRDLGKLDKPVAQRVLKKIDWLSENFERVVPEPLSGSFKGTFKSFLQGLEANKGKMGKSHPANPV